MSADKPATASPTTEIGGAPTSPAKLPYDAIGGDAEVLALAEAFYDAMDATEPALAKMHELDGDGRVSRRSRDRFGLFLIGWLGGPQTYMERHGHPRLRMRHADVAVDSAARDAWLRCMQHALNARNITGDLRAFLDFRFADVADFLRNRPDGT